MSEVRFGILGPLEVRVDGRPVRLHGPRQERVLAALLLDAGQVTSIDRLVDIVWDTPPASARRQIQDLVARLRRTLVAAGAPDDVIVTHRGGYLLRPPALDYTEFEETVAAARGAVSVDDAAAVELFRRALRLWRGEPLAGLNCPALDGAAAALHERRLAVVEECVEVELSLGRHHELVAELVALVERHPLRETLVALLMRALAAAGRPADASETYRRLRERIAEELGIDPDPRLRRLHEQILRTAADADAPGPASDTAPLAPTTPLPMDVYGFAGRERELAWLDGLPALAGRQPTAVIVAVVSGGAGVGKTTLAVHWAHRVRDRFPDGCLYVDLRGFGPHGAAVTPGAAVRGFLAALGVPPGRFPPTVDAQIALYRSMLAGRRVLLVLDNARDAEQVRPLLPGSPGCVVVVTSRSRLPGLVAGEGARPLPLDLPSVAEAREMLARRLGAARVDAEPEATEKIIDGCGRLPLALAVAAARAAVRPDFPLASVAEEVRDARLDALDTGDPATQVRAVFSWSYRTLSAEAARLFRLLGALRGPAIGLAAVTSLAGLPKSTTRRLLAELTDANLVTEPTPGRYTLHDLMRVYADELGRECDPPREREAALRRLFDHYLNTAAENSLRLDPHSSTAVHRLPCGEAGPAVPSGADDAAAWFRAEHAALIAAVEHAAASGFDDHAWRLARTLITYLDQRGHWHDMVTVLTLAVEATRRMGDDRGLADAHRSLSWIYGRLDRPDTARDHAERALALYGRLGDRIGRAYTHACLSGVFERAGRYRDALAYAERALTLFTEAGARGPRARALATIGWMHARLGDHRTALDYCERGLAEQEEAGDRRGQANTWDSLGYIHHHLGDHRRAVACFTRALDLLGEDGDRLTAAETLLHLGDAHRALGEDGEAARSWRRALDVLEDFGHPDADAARERLASLPSSSTG